MIIKGGSRGAPGQLAWHLQRRDTNGNVQILELQSPAPNLVEAFRDWQTLTEGTRGLKGLYHANIDPAQGYTMTREQWQRAVDVLEEELKLQGQPRAIVLHKKHGREHIHVVWARTDIDRMVLRSDSQNYLAHERASQRLEHEFRHEPVPGKHAKRDREKQPEFPKAEANQAEWQQGERTGLDLTARKDQITALRQSSDSAQAFKTALEESGYILAKGDRRDFVIVDEAGSIHSLGRQIRDMKAAGLRAFMKDIDREKLPTAEDAVALQDQRRDKQQSKKHQELEHQEEQKQPQQSPEQEAPPQPQQQQPEPQPEQREEEPQPEHLQQQHQDEREEREEDHQEEKAQQQDRQQDDAERETREPPKPDDPSIATQDRPDAEREALKAAVAKQQAEERARLIEAQTTEMEELGQTLARDTEEKLERFDAIQREQAEARLHRQEEEEPTGFGRLVSALQDIFSPDRAAQREAERQRQQEEFLKRQQQEREDYVGLLKQTNDLEVENVTERHAFQLHDHAAKSQDDLERYLRELEAARQLQAEIEERQRERTEELARDGPERPPPRRAR